MGIRIDPLEEARHATEDFAVRQNLFAAHPEHLLDLPRIGDGRLAFGASAQHPFEVGAPGGTARPQVLDHLHLKAQFFIHFAAYCRRKILIRLDRSPRKAYHSGSSYPSRATDDEESSLFVDDPHHPVPTVVAHVTTRSLFPITPKIAHRCFFAFWNLGPITNSLSIL